MGKIRLIIDSQRQERKGLWMEHILEGSESGYYIKEIHIPARDMRIASSVAKHPKLLSEKSAIHLSKPFEEYGLR